MVQQPKTPGRRQNVEINKLHDGWDQEMDGFKHKNPNIILSTAKIKEGTQKKMHLKRKKKKIPLASVRVRAGEVIRLGGQDGDMQRFQLCTFSAFKIIYWKPIHSGRVCVCVCGGISHTHNQCT